MVIVVGVEWLTVYPQKNSSIEIVEYCQNRRWKIFATKSTKENVNQTNTILRCRVWCNQNKYWRRWFITIRSYSNANSLHFFFFVRSYTQYSTNIIHNLTLSCCRSKDKLRVLDVTRNLIHDIYTTNDKYHSYLITCLSPFTRCLTITTTRQPILR